MEPIRFRQRKMHAELSGAPAAGAFIGLPEPVSSFVGRERELARLQALIDKTRLLTLTGTGGSGKTRLALELAHQVADRFGDGAFFVDLAPLTDAQLFTSTIAAALGIHAEPRRQVFDTVVSHLADRSVLLLLDNLEHLLEATPELAELLAECPNLFALATSRAPLHLRGEHEYRVDPLALPTAEDLISPDRLAQTEAVALFLERARSVDQQFELTAGNGPAIAEICRCLDGLPLAIELAAARAKVLGPDALLRRLGRRLSLLTTGASDAPARQRTLRDTIAWSYDLLRAADRAVFARAAVFAGGFSLQAAEAVITDPAERGGSALFEALSRLVDHNLLVVASDPEGEPRFGLLETMREFALERLSKRESVAVRARHAKYFAEVAEIASGQGGHANPALLRRFADDPDNFRAALAWADTQADADLLIRLATALRGPFGAVGHPTEAGRWLHRAEELAASPQPRLRAALLYTLVRYELGFVGDRDRAERLLHDALRTYEELGDDSGRAWTLMMLSNVAADRGEGSVAADRARRAVELARAIGDRLERTRLLAESAGMGSAARSLAEGRTLAEEALAAARELGDPASLTDALLARGMNALAFGEVALAVDSLAEGLAIQLPDGPDLYNVKVALAPARLRAGDLATSRSLVQELLLRVQEVESTMWFGLNVLEATADLLGACGQSDQAATLWAAIDSRRAIHPDRSYYNDVGLFAASRQRDWMALSARRLEAAEASGRAMNIRDAIAFGTAAIEALAVASAVASASGQKSRGRYELTPREQQVLTLLAGGRSDGQIAQALMISRKTAAVHVGNIKGKLGAGTRVEIVTLAQAQGLVRLSASPTGSRRNSGRPGDMDAIPRTM